MVINSNEIAKNAAKELQKITRKQSLLISRDDVVITISKSGAGYSVHTKTESGRETLKVEGRTSTLSIIKSALRDEGANITTKPTGYED